MSLLDETGFWIKGPLSVVDAEAADVPEVPAVRRSDSRHVSVNAFRHSGNSVCEGLHFHLASNDERSPLVNRCGLNIENSLIPIRCNSTRLFCNKRDGVGFVQQPKFPRALGLRRWVEKDPTLKQRPMEIRNHGTNVPCRIRPS